MRLLLKDARLILDPLRGINPGWLLLRDGFIEDLGLTGDNPPSGVTEICCGGDYLSPGLVDIHCHGAAGSDAMQASSSVFRKILRHHARFGTTTLVLTTVAASLNRIEAVLKAARDYPRDPEGAFLAGIHLEGPWFSPRRCGAHDPAQLRFPEITEIETLMVYRDVIRRITLAPELPRAGVVVRMFRDAGVSVSAGHSDATQEESLKGFAAGITQVTHLYNAMSSMAKTDPPREGLVEAALRKKDILCELIADGVHVREQLIREALVAKGWERIALVSDATAGTGLPNGVGFLLGSLECIVDGNAARTELDGGGCLAGSTSPLFQGIRTMAGEVGVPLAEAVAMATLVPARSLGLEGQIGSLEIGKRADLIRFSSQWEMKGVWIGGREIGGR